MRMPGLLLMALLMALSLLLVCGCRGGKGSQRPVMLGPATMRINPTFTRIGSQGIQADIELADTFGDPAKGGGAITFELFRYAATGTDIRGDRIGAPARFDLSTAEAQQTHWQPVVRTYRFDLPWRNLDTRVPYLLIATYDPTSTSLIADGSPATRPVSRLFDRHVIQPPTTP